MAHFASGKLSGPVLTCAENLLLLPDIRAAFGALCDAFDESKSQPKSFQLNLRIRNFPACAFEWQSFGHTAGVGKIVQENSDIPAAPRTTDTLLYLGRVNHSDDDAATAGCRKLLGANGGWMDTPVQGQAYMPILIDYCDAPVMYMTPSNDICNAIGIALSLHALNARLSTPPQQPPKRG